MTRSGSLAGTGLSNARFCVGAAAVLGERCLGAEVGPAGLEDLEELAVRLAGAQELLASGAVSEARAAERHGTRLVAHSGEFSHLFRLKAATCSG